MDVDELKQTLVPAVLSWSRTHLRSLPWRDTRDPWLILVSEIMLQQTQADRVVPKWHVFIDRFPTASACAQAPVGEVIELWQGLGYNRRAINLWRTATVIVTEHGGEVPRDYRALKALPGIGPYTARAVQVFAFESPVGVVDTNVGRLLARWAGVAHSRSGAQLAADGLVPSDNSWRWNQTLFDFANAVCTKRSPSCGACPVGAWCSWRGIGPDPATGSAAVSARQSPFQGSDRQVRGRIVDRLRSGPAKRGELRGLARPGDDDRSFGAILDGLVRDGLIDVSGADISLPSNRP